MKVLTIALIELKILFRMRASLVWFFVMPVVFAVFFGMAFRGQSNQQPLVSLGVVNADNGFLGHNLVDSLKVEGFQVTIFDRQDVQPGEQIPRILYIPADFTRRVLDGEQTDVTLRKDEDANVDASQTAQVNIFRSIIRVIGNLALMNLKSGTTDQTAQAEAYAAAVPKSARVTLNVERAGTLKRIPSGFNQSLPGMMVMFVLLCILIYGITMLVLDRSRGLLQRVSLGPIPPWQILGGKFLSRVLAGGIQIVVLLLVGRLAFSVFLGTSPLGLALLVTAYAASVASLAMLIGAWVRSAEQASGFGILLTMVMSAMGGCWWPLEVVPPPIKHLAFLFPTGWVMEGLQKLMAFGYGLESVLPNVMVLLGMAGVLFALATWRLRRELITGR